MPSLGKGQKVEVKATSIEILGDSDANEYPLQLKNKPTLEYLREKAHLRFRTNTFSSVFRIRHTLAFAIHKFFNEKGFVYLHTPIITASDAEGAGEMFRVSTLPLDNPLRALDPKFDLRALALRIPVATRVQNQRLLEFLIKGGVIAAEETT